VHCTPNKCGRHVHRSVFAEYQERVKSYHQTSAYQKAMDKRKVWVEPLFAEGKQWHGMGRFRLRRLWRVNCEAQIIAAGQNLKRLLQQRGWGRRPFPTPAGALLAPPNDQTDEPHRYDLLKSSKRSVAVLSLLALESSRCLSSSNKLVFSHHQHVFDVFTVSVSRGHSSSLEFSLAAPSSGFASRKAHTFCWKLDRAFFNRLVRLLTQ
jgi:Transposase DDE domain